MMTYKFSCPFPCNRVIYVKASDTDDAVQKIIEVGGLACRNGNRYCGIVHPRMSPLPDPRLRDLIRSFMEQEELVVSNHRAIEAYIGQGTK
jgi:hypothetical protein